MATYCKTFLTPKDFNLIIKTSEVVQYDGPAFSCVSLPGSPTLNNVLSAIESKVCNIQNTQLQNIVTSQIVDYDGTTAFGCFSLTGSAPLNTIISELATQICVNTTALGALDCTDIEVTAVYTAVNYTPASAHLCGHLEGIDDELATFLTSIPSCLGNNLFTDGNNGFFETGITGMASTDFALAQSTVQAYQGTKSLKATMGGSTTNSRIHGTTTISFTSGETYILSGYVYAPSANSTGGTTKMLAWDGASEFTELTPVDIVDTSAVQDGWVLIQTTLQPSTNKSLTIGIKAEGLSNTDKIFIDQLEVRCGSQNLVTEEELTDRFKRLVCSWTIEGGNITTGAGSLDVDIDASLYEVSGAFVTVPDTATTTSITLAATSDNYIDVDRNGNYLVTSVAIAASEPAVAANRMRLFKVTTDGVGVTATVDRQNIYPFCNGSAFGNQIIETRHLKDLNVTGAKMENAVTGASVDVANITFDNKGRITAATSYFTITAPATGELLQYNGTKWVNVAILGTILPTANNNETLRYDTGATAWQGSGYLINTGSAIGINLTTPQTALNLAKNLEFTINMAEPTGVGSALAAGGSLTPGTTYYYVVTALDSGSGETVVSAETTKTADAVNKTINISWSAVIGTSTYRVYKGVATGVYTEYFTITAPIVIYSDTGAAGAAGSPPSVTTAYVVSLGSSYFLDQVGIGIITSTAMLHIKGNGVATKNFFVEDDSGTDSLTLNNDGRLGLGVAPFAGYRVSLSNPDLQHGMQIHMSSTHATAGRALFVVNTGSAAPTNTGILINCAGAATNNAIHVSAGNIFFPMTSDAVTIGHATVQTAELVNIKTKVLNGDFQIKDNTGAASFIVTDERNVGIIATTFGTNADGVFGIGIGVAPTTRPVDMFQVYTVDASGVGTASPRFMTEDNAAITLATTSLMVNLTLSGVMETSKGKMTSIGGFAVKLTNKTGAVTVAGQIVKADTANDDAVILTAADELEVFGVFLDSGIADAAEAWVVIAGIADVAMEDNTGATRGNWVRTSVAEAGYADATNAAAPAPINQTHFAEIGHCIETVGAGGGGTHILSRCIVHFN